MNGKTVKRCVHVLLLIGLILMAYPLAGTTEPAVRAQVLSAAPPAKEWDKIFGGGNVLPATQVVQTSDGGYAIIGNSGNYHTPSVAFLVKTDSAGNMQWSKNYDYVYNVAGLVQTSDGGYVLSGSGYTEEEKRQFGSHTPVGIILVKTDSEGNVRWSQTYNGRAHAMIQTNDGGFAIAGGSALTKTDSLGKVQWSKAYGEQSISSIHALIQTIDGGYAWAGGKAFTEKAQLNSNSETLLLIKADSNGNVVWSQSYGEVPRATDHYWGNEANSLIQTEDEGFILAGNTYLYGAGDSDAWLIKTDSSGKMIWNHTYGGYGSLTLENAIYEPFVMWSNGTGWDYANSIIKTSDGGLAFAGTTQFSMISGFSIAWLVKLDSNGTAQWNTTYSNYEQGGRGSWGANSLIETSEGGFALAGFYEVGSSTNYYFLVKTEPTLPPPTPTPTQIPIPSSSPSTGSSPELNLALFTSLASIVIVIVVAAVVILRRRKKKSHFSVE
jgi:hypothetical protein